MRFPKLSFVVGMLFGLGIMLGLFASLQAAVAEELPHQGYIIGFHQEQVDSVTSRLAPKAGKNVDVRGLALRSMAKELELKPRTVLSGVNAIVVQEELPAIAKRFQRSKAASKVRYIEPNYIVSAVATPNDPSYGSLWGMANSRADVAWDSKTDSSDVVVAVIDTGIDYTHPDLAANMWQNPGEIAGDGIDNDGNGFVDDVYGADFINIDGNPYDDNSHGTHCAGTIGAVGNNGVGVAGVNWNVKLMGLKFLGSNGSGSTAGAVGAILYAVNKRSSSNIRVLSNSWGGGGYSQALADAITAARNSGMVFVAAAGNSALNVDSAPSYPASYTNDNIVSVAAITSSDGLAYFSNYGATGVDLGAPGYGILSTVPGGGYASYSGTSMATPHVSGAAAMMLSENPNLTAIEVRDALMGTSRPIAALSGKTVSGGTLDVAAALSSVANTPPAPAPATYGISGTITASGVALSGVTVSLGSLGNTTTNSLGQYSFSGLVDGSNYTLTPSKAGYLIAPSSLSGTLTADAVHNFTAAPLPKFAISGTVIDSATGKPVAGVTLGLVSNNVLISVGVTRKSGAWAFKYLPSGVTYQVVAVSPTHTITPNPYTVTLNANASGVALQATRKSVGVTMNFIDRKGRPYSGLAVTVDPLGVQTVTSSAGSVQLSGLPAGIRQKVTLRSSTRRWYFYTAPVTDGTSMLIRLR